MKLKIIEPPRGVAKKRVSNAPVRIQKNGMGVFRIVPSHVGEAMKQNDLVVWDRGHDVVVYLCVQTPEVVKKAGELICTEYSDRSVEVRAANPV